MFIGLKDSGAGERERNSSVREKYQVVAFCTHPNWGSNPRPLVDGTTLPPTEPPGQGSITLVRGEKKFWKNFRFELQSSDTTINVHGVRSLHLSLSETLTSRMGGPFHLPRLVRIYSVEIHPWPQSVEHFNVIIFAPERASI